MQPVWAAEVAVEHALAKDLIEEQFPDLHPVSTRLLGAGWDNSAYLVNESFIFRFPRRQVAVPLIKTEIELLPWLSSRVPLRVPVPTYAGKPSVAYQWPFVGYALIPGKWLPAARLSDRERLALAIPLGQFLRDLHHISAEEARLHGAGPDVLDRLNVELRRMATEERLTTLRRMGVIENCDQIEAVLNRAPVVARPRSDALIHGDLHAGQMLVGADNQIRAVIDWGDVHVGDPAVDLAAVHAVLPSDAHPVFLEAYGPVDDVAWSAARARALWHTIAVLAHAADTGSIDMIDEAKQGLARILTA
jgi:aminoglycoside phosphotransferase (APT) family kinase protein